MKQGLCKLCLLEKPLVKAHIYPHFMYEPSMFDEKNRMIFIEENKFLVDDSIKFQQSGFWDNNILCERCDNEIISRFESYGHFLLYGGQSNDKYILPVHQTVPNADFDFIRFQNVEYKEYKCFLLSLIWRASISKLKIFKTVDLGKDHNERIRQYLLAGNPGPEDHYEVLVCSIRAADILLKDIVTNGQTFRMRDGGRVVSIFIGGLGYIFSIGAIGQKIPELFSQCTPTIRNETSIVSFKSKRGRDVVLRMVGLNTLTKI